MKNLNLALKLKYLYHLKSMGFHYTKPIKDFEIKESFELPNDMLTLKNACMSCHLCELAKSRKSVVFGEGDENAKVMFIGEGPGEMEDKSGRPFVGAAGETLTKMIENVVGIKREEAYIANIVKCRPPNNRVPAPSEVASCKPYLEKQIKLINPKLIVALGGTALNSLLNQNYSIMKMRGIELDYHGIPLLPTYHPSFIIRNPNTAKKAAFADMLMIKGYLQEGV